ncbi:MAG: carboxypeptidase-like regulatory domain-containing protein, partial [Prevotella sp.]|nr:carboxypeptidase-like regulatory domain-containing protein [Prevotella sp.]
MLVCCFVFAGVQAQKITRDYNNVSLSEALRQLNEQTEEYTISFLYNELEDFRITTSVHRKTVPDAIRQMIGFYPIRMTVEPGIANPSQQEIIVECPQKTALRYKGTVIDEQGQPVAYANIALLSPQDSTLITGGVSNESGLFVIPCETQPVLARISFVGYKTEFVMFDSRNARNIRLKPETIMLNGVKVTGDRIFSKAENGHLTYNMPM